MKFPKGFFKYDIERLIALHREGKINEFRNLKSSPTLTTIFHYFGKNRRFDMIDYFLKLGNITIDFGEPTLLMMGCKKGNFKLVEESIKRGANVNKISDGTTPLLASINNQNAKIVNYLLKNGADPNEGDGENIPLSRAFEDGNGRLMKLLLKYKADPNRYIREDTSEGGGEVTLLYSACEDMKEEVVKLLLKYGANPNTGDDNIPLLIACENEDHTIVEMLLKGGADVNSCEESGIFPIVYNASIRRNIDLMELFLRCGFDINSPFNGDTILHCECKNNDVRIETINFFLEKGCNINELDMLGNTPLEIVVQRGQVEAVKFLLDQGAEVEYNEKGEVKYLTESFFNEDSTPWFPHHNHKNILEIEKVFEEYLMRRNKKGISYY